MYFTWCNVVSANVLVWSLILKWSLYSDILAFLSNLSQLELTVEQQTFLFGLMALFQISCLFELGNLTKCIASDSVMILNSGSLFCDMVGCNSFLYAFSKEAAAIFGNLADTSARGLW